MHPGLSEMGNFSTNSEFPELPMQGVIAVYNEAEYGDSREGDADLGRRDRARY